MTRPSARAAPMQDAPMPRASAGMPSPRILVEVYRRLLLT